MILVAILILIMVVLNIYIALIFLRNFMCTLVAQLCPTLCNPMDSSSPGSSVRGIFQARILEWAAISFSRASSLEKDQGSNLPDPGLLHCRQILYHLSHW